MDLLLTRSPDEDVRCWKVNEHESEESLDKNLSICVAFLTSEGWEVRLAAGETAFYNKNIL